MAIEIGDLPIQNSRSFHSKLLVYQRVSIQYLYNIHQIPLNHHLMMVKSPSKPRKITICQWLNPLNLPSLIPSLSHDHPYLNPIKKSILNHSKPIKTWCVSRWPSTSAANHSACWAPWTSRNSAAARSVRRISRTRRWAKRRPRDAERPGGPGGWCGESAEFFSRFLGFFVVGFQGLDILNELEIFLKIDHILARNLGIWCFFFWWGWCLFGGFKGLGRT